MFTLLPKGNFDFDRLHVTRYFNSCFPIKVDKCFEHKVCLNDHKFKFIGEELIKSIKRLRKWDQTPGKSA